MSCVKGAIVTRCSFTLEFATFRTYQLAIEQMGSLDHVDSICTVRANEKGNSGFHYPATAKFGQIENGKVCKHSYHKASIAVLRMPKLGVVAETSGNFKTR
jgi:hypothetical protein